MKQFLKKIKLIEEFTTEVEMTKSAFVTKFRQNVDEASIGIFADSFDVFSSSKNEYKGDVAFDGFKIKRRRRFFGANNNLAIATGTYVQNNEILVINTEINGFSKKMIPFYAFIIVFYCIFISSFFTLDDPDKSKIALPFICFHALFMFGLPYFMMMRSTKSLKHDLERDFYFFTKK